MPTVRELGRQKAQEVMVRMIVKDIIPLTQQLIDKGLAGDISAIKELFDRGFGKAQQNIDLLSDGKALPRPLLYALLQDGSKLSLTSAAPPMPTAQDYTVIPPNQEKENDLLDNHGDEEDNDALEED